MISMDVRAMVPNEVIHVAKAAEDGTLVVSLNDGPYSSQVDF